MTSAFVRPRSIASETLFYDDPLHQGRADVEARSLFGAVMNGADPFTCVAAYHQKTYETVHLSKQHRKVRTPDEVMNMPGDRMVLVVDGLPGPVYAARAPYWTCPWMAGRYHPNPFHPPLDRVLVTTERGPSWRPVITQTVPIAFAQYPQYRGGTWSFIGA